MYISSFNSCRHFSEQRATVRQCSPSPSSVFSHRSSLFICFLICLVCSSAFSLPFFVHLFSHLSYAVLCLSPVFSLHLFLTCIVCLFVHPFSVFSAHLFSVFSVLLFSHLSFLFICLLPVFSVHLFITCLLHSCFFTCLLHSCVSYLPCLLICLSVFSPVFSVHFSYLPCLVIC